VLQRENISEIRMKVFIILTALLAFINTCSAISVESLRVEVEFRTQMFELEIAIITQSSNISRNVQTRVDAYRIAYSRLRDDVGTSLLLLPGGINAALKINAEANNIINSLLTEFSDYKILTTILNRVSEIRKTFVTVLENEIKLLENEIDKKPRAVKCWDENKGAMRTLVKKALNDGIASVNKNLVGLQANVTETVGKVDGVISLIRKDVGTCGFNPSCITKYVRNLLLTS
jgi:hypothetical protein